MAGVVGQELFDETVNEFKSLFSNITKPSNKSNNNEPAITGPTTENPFFRDTFFHPDLIEDSEPCKVILHYHIGSSDLRVWDVIIFIPNIIFLLFLFYQLPTTRQKLRSSQSSLCRALYFIILTCSLISSFRCFLGMIIHLDNIEHDMADKGIWVTCQFVLLSAELFVAALGVSFGITNNIQNIQRIAFSCSLLSFVLCAIQAYLEIFRPFYGFQVSNGFYLYGHGGPIYWAVTSTALALVYLLILSTLLCPSHFLPTILPHSHNFYIYVAIQFVIHALTAIGAIMLSSNIHSGICITNMTSFMSFSLFSPLIFFCFLYNWLETSQPSLLFAYRAQMDDLEDGGYVTTMNPFRKEDDEVPLTSPNSCANENI